MGDTLSNCEIVTHKRARGGYSAQLRLGERNDPRDEPLLSHLINLRLEVLDNFVNEVGKGYVSRRGGEGGGCSLRKTQVWRCVAKETAQRGDEGESEAKAEEKRGSGRPL